MWAFVRCFVALAGLSLLVACAEPAIPYDRGSGRPISSVGVLTTHWPDTPRAMLASSVGKNLGLIGSLVDLAMEEARNSQLHAIANAHHFVASDRFDTDLRAAIAADGYRVVPIVQSRSDSNYLSDYHTLTGADAWLDCAGLYWGYIAAGIADSTPYRPSVIVKCRLVRATDQTILMRDTLFYNPVGLTGTFVELAPDPSFAYVTFDKLTADPNGAVAGMDAAFQHTTQAVGTLLK
jgi:hypothetical protein